jgi:uncharacterized protein YxjI
LSATREELKKKYDRVVVLMLEIDDIKEQISDILKVVKEEYEIDVPTSRRIATVMKKKSRSEEEEKWEEFTKLLDMVGA